MKTAFILILLCACAESKPAQPSATELRSAYEQAKTACAASGSDTSQACMDKTFACARWYEVTHPEKSEVPLLLRAKCD